MDDSKALSIVAMLANGVNPVTGEAFAADSPYQSPDIVRALFVAARVMEAGVKPAPSAPSAGAPRSRPDAPGNVGKPWSPDEDQRLLAEFEQGRKPAELARIFGRTLAGIEARLEKHGRLTPQQRQTINRYTKGGSEGNASTQTR